MNTKEGTSRAATLTYGTAHRLGSVIRSARNGVFGVGRFICKGPDVLARFSHATEWSPRKTPPPSAMEGIRSIVVEELSRLRETEHLTNMPEFEARLRHMSRMIETLQDRIKELNARGPISEADMWKEIRSLDTADSLTGDEQVLLASVFRQNVVLQRPDLADDNASGKAVRQL